MTDFRAAWLIGSQADTMIVDFVRAEELGYDLSGFADVPGPNYFVARLSTVPKQYPSLIQSQSSADSDGKPRVYNAIMGEDLSTLYPEADQEINVGLSLGLPYLEGQTCRPPAEHTITNGGGSVDTTAFVAFRGSYRTSIEDEPRTMVQIAKVGYVDDNSGGGHGPTPDSDSVLKLHLERYIDARYFGIDRKFAQAAAAVVYGPAAPDKAKRKGGAKKKPGEMMDPGDVALARTYDGVEQTELVSRAAPEAAAEGRAEREAQLFAARELRYEREAQLLDAQGKAESERIDGVLYSLEIEDEAENRRSRRHLLRSPGECSRGLRVSTATALTMSPRCSATRTTAGRLSSHMAPVATVAGRCRHTTSCAGPRPMVAGTCA